MQDFSRLSLGSRLLLGQIIRRGWPLTKAAYVKAMNFPYDPTFPLDAETEARVPLELDGAMPTSLTDLSEVRPLSPSPGSSRRPSSSPPTSPPDGRVLPEPLIEQVMLAYGFTRQEAEDAIKAFGG
jgi:hypothetical protein